MRDDDLCATLRVSRGHSEFDATGVSGHVSPWLAMPAATSRPSLMSVSMTLAPSVAKRVAQAQPMPLAAPVINATLAVSRFMSAPYLR
jgi:hypothetical protein